MTDRPTDSPIRPECWAEFCTDYAVVWDQLVFLRTSLFLLRQLADFPLRTLVQRDDQWFLTVVGRSLYETVILGLTKLVTDQKGDLLTIRGWRNRVRTMLLPERVAAYQEHLSDTALNRAAEMLAERARAFRDGHVAHLRLDDVRAGHLNSLALDDLERLVTDTERLFQPLLFGGSAGFLPPVYDPAIRASNEHRKTDLENILDFLAAGSFVLNEPETHPRTWSARRAKMNPDELAVFNDWRKRVGKPCV